MISYLNKHTVQGMLSSRYKPLDDYSGFIKNSKSFVMFNIKRSLIESYMGLYDKVFLSYIDEDNFNIFKEYHLPHSKSKSSSIISLFNHEFFQLKGKQHREMKETKNHYNKLLTVKYDIDNIQEVVELIDEWNALRGKEKYGWINHSGYDKTFFLKYYDLEKDNLISNFYYDNNNKLVGYAVVSKYIDVILDDNLPCYKYVIRKYLPKLRNLSLYCDFKMFERIYHELQCQDFCVHWGASSGSLLQYKKKFPVYNISPTYFISIKNG